MGKAAKAGSGACVVPERRAPLPARRSGAFGRREMPGSRRPTSGKSTISPGSEISSSRVPARTPERKIIRGLVILGWRGFLSGIQLLPQPLDFALKALDRGFVLLERVDPLFHRPVLLEQRLGVGFLLGVDLLGIRRRVVGRRRAGHSRDGPEGKRLGPRRMVIPVRALLPAVERMPFVHFVREIRIGVAAHRIRLHRFRRADFRHFCRRNVVPGTSAGWIDRTSFFVAQPEKRQTRIMAWQDFMGESGWLAVERKRKGRPWLCPDRPFA